MTFKFNISLIISFLVLMCMCVDVNGQSKSLGLNTVVIDLKNDEGRITCNIDSPIITEIGGVVSVSDTLKRREITVTAESGDARVYAIPYGSRLKVVDEYIAVL